MKIHHFIILSLLINFSLQAVKNRPTKQDRFTEQADTIVAVPWGINSSNSHTKEGNVFLVSLFGNVDQGKQWTLQNEEELRTKWNFEPLNLD